MAFPTTSVLDDFNRGSLGSGWTSPLKLGESSLAISGSVQLAANNTNTYCSAYYNASTYGPDCEVYASIASAPLNGVGHIALWLGVLDTGTGAPDGYQLLYDYYYGTHYLHLHQVTNGAWPGTQITSYSTGTAPTKIGASRVGTTLKIHYHNGTAWAEGASVTDSTHTGAGHIGVGLYEYDDEYGPYYVSRIDDFGGGTIAASGARPNYNKTTRFFSRRF